MTEPTPDAEPAGGTTTPFVRWTSGSFCFQGAHDAAIAEGLYAARRRGRDLRALARGGRLRARRRGLDRGSGAPGVHDHPAATEHHRLAPPRSRPADRGRGPDDPARPDARASDAIPPRP